MRTVTTVVFGLLLVLYGLKNLPNDAPARTVPTVPEPKSKSVVVTEMNNTLHVEGYINNRPVTFQVDTGASYVCLSYKAAKALGILPNRRAFKHPAATANGVTKVAIVNIKKISVGNLKVRNIEANILPKGSIQDNLLGMSFLNQMRWSYASGKLKIEER